MPKGVAAWMPTLGSRPADLRLGYTLIEVVVAVAIAASVIALSVPSMIRSVERSQERQVIAGVISALYSMRAQTVLDNRDVDSVAIAARLRDILPEGWVLRVAEEFHVSRTGFCLGGNIQLETPRARMVSVRPLPKFPCSLSATAEQAVDSTIQ
jgi:prepilin-type N-terminal cleavage/methylation domain-containing protein